MRPSRCLPHLRQRGFVLVDRVLSERAVQAAREAARRSACSNNLKQIGLAVLNSADTNKRLPISIHDREEDFSCNPRIWIGPQGGSANRTDKGGPGLLGKGWIVDILPQMEQQAMYQRLTEQLKIDKSFGIHPTNGTGKGLGHANVREIVSAQHSFLSCPSDDSAKPNPDLWYWAPVPTGVTNYKGCIGDHGVTDGINLNSPVPPNFGAVPDCHNTAETNGMFGRNTSIKPIELKMITDGQSNTFMVGENVVWQDYHSAAFYSDGDWASA